MSTSVEPIAFEQAADADGRAGIFQLDQVQAKTEFAVAGDGASGDVAASVGEGARAAIANIFQKRRLVQQFEKESGVVQSEAPHHQPFCFQNFHRGDVSMVRFPAAESYDESADGANQLFGRVAGGADSCGAGAGCDAGAC